jgi:gliding motility-associated-like protein
MKVFITACYFLLYMRLFSQASFPVALSLKNMDCTKGAAAVVLDSLKSGDVPTYNWSTGESSQTINNLQEGDFSVQIKVAAKIDTTINFSIAKVECPVTISNHFTPNSDSYNDTWQITNLNNFPNFEVFVFNKWGQQVHTQKGTYEPWTGGNLPDGTYYYLFFFDTKDNNKKLKGDVAILR